MPRGLISVPEGLSLHKDPCVARWQAEQRISKDFGAVCYRRWHNPSPAPEQNLSVSEAIYSCTLVAMLKGNTKGLVGSLVADVVASVRTEPVGHVRENRKPVSLRGALITRMRLLRETPLRRMLLLLIGEKTPPCA